jgi:hypothetical protein
MALYITFLSQSKSLMLMLTSLILSKLGAFVELILKISYIKYWIAMDSVIIAKGAKN